MKRIIMLSVMFIGALFFTIDASAQSPLEGAKVDYVKDANRKLERRTTNLAGAQGNNNASIVGAADRKQQLINQLESLAPTSTSSNTIISLPPGVKVKGN